MSKKLQIVFDNLAESSLGTITNVRYNKRTSSDESDKVFSSAGKVPSSIAKIYVCFG